MLKDMSQEQEQDGMRSNGTAKFHYSRAVREIGTVLRE